MREEICYRSLFMQTLPPELSDIVLGQKLNCTQAHAFLSQYFGPRRGKTEEQIMQEEEIWRRVGEIHFPNEGVSTSDTFADLCSKRNPMLSEALDELLQTIFNCVDYIHKYYNRMVEEGEEGEEINMRAFEDFKTLRENYDFYTGIRGYSPRRFLVDYQDSLYFLCLHVSQLAYDHEDSHELIAINDQQENWEIGKFVEMFRHNSNLVVPNEEPVFYPNEDEPEKLKWKIWTQYDEIPEFVVDAYDLLRKSEDSIYVSHLYLTGKWIDEVTVSSETLLDSVTLGIEELEEEFIDLLPVIGVLVMRYVEDYDLPDNNWLSEETLEMEEDKLLALKKHFREGAVETNMDGTKTPYFMTSYLSGDFSAQDWADILVEGNSPPWCFDEQTLTGDDVTQSFTLSIRYKNLKDWMNSINVFI
jgi:hypothetical protein